MPTVVDCPSCARKLRVPDELLGHKVKCPTCEITFEAAVNGSTAAPRAAPPPLPSSPPPAPKETPAERDEERRPCPFCGELIRATATRCRHCNEPLDDRDEDDDEHENRWRRPVVRRDAEPHRGTLIMVLGIISIVLGVTWILSPVGVFLGIPAWVMGG